MRPFILSPKEFYIHREEPEINYRSLLNKKRTTKHYSELLFCHTRAASLERKAYHNRTLIKLLLNSPENIIKMYQSVERNDVKYFVYVKF